ncbi:hypothetical protein AGMMS49928_25900 [Spirochaetia bacterium]|nr:hypothetical protein AGMMS49928_25900 [Spirochaetia bacterium]
MRYDIRLKHSADIHPARKYGLTEGGKRADSDSAGGDGSRSIQRERILILQPGKEIIESDILGQDWILVDPKEAGERQVSLARG